MSLRRAHYKRKRSAENHAAAPTGWMECESLTMISILPSMIGTTTPTTKGESSSILLTPLASVITKEIFLERFRKEIIERFQFSLNHLSFSKKRRNQESPASSSFDQSSKKETCRILKSRILVGFCVCSKALQQKGETGNGHGRPLDLVVLSSDFRPTHFAAHVPVLARQRNIPLLLLPGDNSSTELGRLLGVRSAGVLGFVSSEPTTASRAPAEGATTREEEIHKAVDSFVDFIKSKV